MRWIKNMRHNRRDGFTLLELVMAMVVMGITSVPLSLFLYQHIEGTFQAQGRTQAAELARCEMERVTNLDYDTLSTATVTNYAGQSFDLDRTVSYVQGNSASAESLKQIQVAVRRSGATEVLAELRTYRARHVQFGH